MQHYDDWTSVQAADWPWPNFSPRELACRGSGAILVVPPFMERLQHLRSAWRGPLRVTSGYRSPAHNAAVSSTGRDGPHTTGRAVDIAIAGADALDLLVLARTHGFTGIGVAQRGPHGSRFIHLDDLESHETAGPRPWMWSY